MIDFERVTASPLSWPVGWKRTANPERNHRFKKHTVAQATEEVMVELRRMGVPDYQVVISTNLALRLDGLPRSNQREPDDRGVAVYFRFGGAPTVLACDRWLDIADNLHAVALHIQALRGQERWGVGTLAQAFAGYKALPETASRRAWWVVLGFEEPPASFEDVRAARRRLASERHPDRGGTTEAMAELNGAVDEARVYFQPTTSRS